MSVTPWVSVEPNDNPAAILGNLPFVAGTQSFQIPTDVVPADATGILVFLWASLSGKNPPFGFWHASVNIGGGQSNWFSLLVAGDPAGHSVAANSQAFWLPMPVDGLVSVTFFADATFASSTNSGQIEIHGYRPVSI